MVPKPTGSINSFEDLTRQFLGRFFQRKKHTKTVTDLMNIRQGKDETLQAYVDRFNDESLQVEHRSDELVISAFINGLHPGVLYRKLAQSTPTTIADLLRRVEHFQKGEDAMRRKRENDKKRR